MDERERARIRAAIDAAEGGGGVPSASDEQLRSLLAGSRTIAIVGASPKPDRPSHGVLLALKAAGWRILPVNPASQALADGVAGLPCYRTLPPQQHHFRTVNALTSLMSFVAQKTAPP